MNVYAKFDGSIGSVLYKPGEQVPPFAPILTLHSSCPSFIKGYIHEELLNDVKIGQQVWIKSNGAADSKEAVQGIVESLGSRIVEYPVRLKLNPVVPVWGREAIIRLENHNPFLLSEKVLILVEEPQSIHERLDGFTHTAGEYYAEIGKPKSVREWFNALIDMTEEYYTKIGKPKSIRDWVDFLASNFRRFDTETRYAITTPAVQPINTALTDIRTSGIEASGIAWDKITGTFLLVSDETMKPGLHIYEMDRQGHLLAVLPTQISGDIDDIESISTDGQYFYVASSLSHSKKGNLNSKRRKLVRLHRDGQASKNTGCN